MSRIGDSQDGVRRVANTPLVQPAPATHTSGSDNQLRTNGPQQTDEASFKSLRLHDIGDEFRVHQSSTENPQVLKGASACGQEVARNSKSGRVG